MTDWFWQKVDVFIAAIFVAVAGIAACQGHEVMVQYIQRLATETNEARLHLLDTQTGLRYRVTKISDGSVDLSAPDDTILHLALK